MTTPKLMALISWLLAAALIAQEPLQQQPPVEAGYLPLDAPTLAAAVGDALALVCRSFEDFAVPIVVDKDGKMTVSKEPSGDEYRAARDAGSILQRAEAYRLLTCGSLHLGQLFDITRSADARARRGAVWLLTRAPGANEPVAPMTLDLLEPLRSDPDPLVRATLAGLPHAASCGARDAEPLVRASWWYGWHRSPYHRTSAQPLSELECSFLERALIDTHPFVRTAARGAYLRVKAQVPATRSEAVQALVSALETDSSPWPRTEFPEWREAPRSIGWMSSLASWIPLPWVELRMPVSYRDGAVGNPTLPVQRLEFLRSAENVTHLPVPSLRESPEPGMRATAAAIHYPPGRVDDATEVSRARLLSDPDADVRLAAAQTFDAGVTYPFPASLVPEVRRALEIFAASASPWERHAAVVLARGLRAHHGSGGALEWLQTGILKEPAQIAADRRQGVLEIVRALLGEIPAGVLQGWDVDALLARPAAATHEQRLELCRSLDPRAAAALAELVAGGGEALAPLVQALADGDPRDAGARAHLAALLAARPRAERESLLAPAAAGGGPAAALAKELLGSGGE